MPVYQKICIICSKNYYTQRLNTLYCSRSCRNRARYLPPNLLASLVRRNSQWAISASRYTSMVQDIDPRADVKTYGKQSDPEDVKDLIRFSELKKREQEREAADARREIEDVFKIGDTNIDENPQDLKIDKLTFTPNIDFSLPDPDDDGLGGRLDDKQTGVSPPSTDNQMPTKTTKRIFGGGIKK